MSIQERIKAIRTQEQLSQEEFAKSIGMERGNYSQLELGNQQPKIETLRKIARNYNKTYEWLIDGKEVKVEMEVNEPAEQYSGRRLQIVDMQVAAGFPTQLNGAHYYYEENPPLVLPFEHFKSGSYVVIKVQGASMEPTICNGDWVVCRKLEERDRFIEGDTFVVLNGDELNVKRVFKDGTTRLRLCSDNPDFAEQVIPQSKHVQLWEIKMRITIALGKSPITSIREELARIQTHLNKLEGK